MMDLLLWGLTISYVKSISRSPDNVVLVVVSGILLWLIVWRGQYEITVNILEELWSKNLINLFVSPLKFSEWVISLVILGIIKASASVVFATTVAFLLYKVGLFVYGWYLIPFFLLLFMTGWWVGFIVAGLILRYGTKVEQFAWSAIYIIAPFSAIYYPLSILPGWAKTISLFIPTSYVFEGAREIVATGSLDTNKLLMSFVLNLVCLLLSILFLIRSFSKVLSRGLVKTY
jgi:ABC-2 type transport system permease protein